MADLTALLAPCSVAVIGASEDVTTIRGMFMKTILRHGFKGPVHAISRSSAEVFGHKTYDHISKAPGPIDLAVLIAPAEACPSVLEDCAKAGVRAAIVIASGFAEEGSDQGRALQAEMQRIAAANNIALCGPNSQGFVDTRSGLAATFSPVAQGLDPVLPRPAPPGRGLAIITQSGALGFGLFDAALANAIPVDRVITTGNEAGLTLADYLNHLIVEDRADGYLLFLEEVRDGPRFIRFAERALAGGKPVVVLRAGRSAAGRRAAASHTGALARQSAPKKPWPWPAPWSPVRAKPKPDIVSGSVRPRAAAPGWSPTCARRPALPFQLSTTPPAPSSTR
jgi:acyl-CoA synthetase (NDP forming)